MKTYATDGASIQCLLCGSISHNPSDVRHRYCDRCRVFHDDLEVCLHCDEPILPGEQHEAITSVTPTGPVKRQLHWECAVRRAVGGVNHQLGRCTCCGGHALPDPPEVSRRYAAQLAAKHFLTRASHACEQETGEEVPPEAHDLQPD
jgi:hypothetical protein